MDEPIRIETPLVIMFANEGKIICHLYPRATDTHEGYGLLICDLVRHVARAFQVDEDDVWEWVEKERHHQTAEFTSPS